LIDAIQLDREKLLSEVKLIKQKRAKQVETVKQEVEQHATAMESFRRYSETLLSSGTTCDVTRSASSLHERADELMKFDVIGHIYSSLPSAMSLLPRPRCWTVKTEILLEPLLKKVGFSEARYKCLS